MAQIQRRGPKVTISYKADPAQEEEVKDVHEAEGGDEKVTRSLVLELLVDHGVGLYWAIEGFGPDRFEALKAQSGGKRALVKEALRRGLEAMESEQGKKKGR